MASSFASQQLDIEMAASLRDRLTRIDESMALLQEMRKETIELFAELFPEMV